MTKQEVFQYLDIVKETGSINMFGASHLISEMFDVSRKEARTLLSQWMKSEYIDEGHTDGVQYYTEKEALDTIRDILKEDSILRESLGIEDMDMIGDDALLSIGYRHYNIYMR
tara:strand:- start:1640 stop:1978 length:339 start_codon:yes stop_codon:yes gene_type:complete